MRKKLIIISLLFIALLMHFLWSYVFPRYHYAATADENAPKKIADGKKIAAPVTIRVIKSEEKETHFISSPRLVGFWPRVEKNVAKVCSSPQQAKVTLHELKKIGAKEIIISYKEV